MIMRSASSNFRKSEFASHLGQIFPWDKAANAQIKPHNEEIEKSPCIDLQSSHADRLSGTSAGQRFEVAALRRPFQLHGLARGRPTAFGRPFHHADDLLDHRTEGGHARDVSRQHQHRKNLSVLRGKLLEAAGQARQIRPRSGRCARNAYFVTLHRRIRPRNSATREHCDADIVRNGVPSDADVVAVPPDLSDGYHPYPQCQVEILADPGRGFGKSLPGYPCVGGRNSKARPVAAEYERKIPPTDGIGNCGDHCRSRHVHGLVALVLNRLCRLLDISHPDEPVIRQWTEREFICHKPEVAKCRSRAIEIVVC